MGSRTAASATHSRPSPARPCWPGAPPAAGSPGTAWGGVEYGVARVAASAGAGGRAGAPRLRACAGYATARCCGVGAPGAAPLLVAGARGGRRAPRRGCMPPCRQAGAAPHLAVNALRSIAAPRAAAPGGARRSPWSRARWARASLPPRRSRSVPVLLLVLLAVSATVRRAAVRSRVLLVGSMRRDRARAVCYEVYTPHTGSSGLWACFTARLLAWVTPKVTNAHQDASQQAPYPIPEHSQLFIDTIGRARRHTGFVI